MKHENISMRCKADNCLRRRRQGGGYEFCSLHKGLYRKPPTPKGTQPQANSGPVRRPKSKKSASQSA